MKILEKDKTLKNKRPDCYNCIYRGTVAGSCHSCCNHPTNTKTLNNPTAQLFGIMASVHRVAPVNVIPKKIKVVGNPHGIRKGWFNYPFNFDPVWLESCSGFKAKEVKK